MISMETIEEKSLEKAICIFGKGRTRSVAHDIFFTESVDKGLSESSSSRSSLGAPGPSRMTRALHPPRAQIHVPRSLRCAQRLQGQAIRSATWTACAAPSQAWRYMWRGALSLEPAIEPAISMTRPSRRFLPRFTRS